MKRHIMPNKNLLPPALSEKELEEWNENVKHTQEMLLETEEVVKKLFGDNHAKNKRRFM